MSIRTLACGITLILLVCLAGCRTPPRGGSSGRDSGVIRADSGTPPPMRDAGGCPTGMICLEDSGGPPPPRDSGGPPPPRDSGGPPCKPTPVDLAAGPFCQMSTWTCIEGCTGTGTCASDCLDADPGVDCGACFNQNLISCTNDLGCQTEWDLLNCCARDNCPTPATAACVMMFCAPEDEAWGTCIMGTEPGACADEVMQCFAP